MTKQKKQVLFSSVTYIVNNYLLHRSNDLVFWDFKIYSLLTKLWSLKNKNKIFYFFPLQIKVLALKREILTHREILLQSCSLKELAHSLYWGKVSFNCWRNPTCLLVVIQGWDSPNSTITVFSCSIGFNSISVSRRQREQNFKVGESQLWCCLTG
jgi:hypothetical protein